MLRLGITAVRLAPVVAPTLVISAVFLIAGDIYTAQPAGLTVHEWGTFTSVAGEDGSAIDWDTLGCKDDLPGFAPNDYLDEDAFWSQVETARGRAHDYAERIRAGDVRHDRRDWGRGRTHARYRRGRPL